MDVSGEFELDATGKIDLSSIYDCPDPRDFYRVLCRLDYRIPAVAAPIFAAVIEEFRATRQRRLVRLLDVGSSYGITGALLKYDLDLGDIVAMYRTPAIDRLDAAQLIERDRMILAVHVADTDLRLVGLDTAENAVAYAVSAGILDGGVTNNLEEADPDEADIALIKPTDLVISTGAVGYVGAPTFARIVAACERRPWFAFFALRMFPIDDITAELRRHGYTIFKLPNRTFQQRRFANRDEADQVLARLRELGIDPAGLEADGWYHAEFFFALPREEAEAKPLLRLAEM